MSSKEEQIASLQSELAVTSRKLVEAESELERARRELQAIVDESGELIGPSVHYSEGRLQKIHSLAIAALKAANKGLGGE